MADNDTKVIQKLKYGFRRCYYNMSYREALPDYEGAEYIRNLLSRNRPFMVCRLGAEESRTTVRWLKGKPYSERNVRNIKLNAGVFPNDISTIDAFCSEYIESLKIADAVFTWGCVGEKSIIKRSCKKDTVILQDTTNLFLFVDSPWTTGLKGKRVLVVHPFVETIKQQYEKRELLFDREILPEFKSIDFVKVVQSNAGNENQTGYNTWFSALRAMKEEISGKEFEIALIAGGAYGIPLAAYVKQIGKQAIHIASNLQILFGIRGRRWDGWGDWTPYFNQYWVYPSESETPKGKRMVEGGSYWR